MRRSFSGSEGELSTATCVVPLHRRDLAVGTLASVLRQAGVDVDTFLDAL